MILPSNVLGGCDRLHAENPARAAAEQTEVEEAVALSRAPRVSLSATLQCSAPPLHTHLTSTCCGRIIRLILPVSCSRQTHHSLFSR